LSRRSRTSAFSLPAQRSDRLFHSRICLFIELRKAHIADIVRFHPLLDHLDADDLPAHRYVELLINAFGPAQLLDRILRSSDSPCRGGRWS
jgi:hypothetical protein